ncbi:hypothetical protein BRC61_06630 [Halobacteriales archaeon QH_10_65_19]|nr:MAG: hypothetical protein BRC61_06630 [Halobacteriales archaeon QH_10_65_19]
MRWFLASNRDQHGAVKRGQEYPAAVGKPLMAMLVRPGQPNDPLKTIRINYSQRVSPSMERLENVSVDELRRALDQAEESKPTQRLLAAIAYKHGVSQTELAEWHGVQRRTIYSWFRRLEMEPLPEARLRARGPPRDAPRAADRGRLRGGELVAATAPAPSPGDVRRRVLRSELSAAPERNGAGVPETAATNRDRRCGD